MIKVLSAWKAVRSEATVTGYEFLGECNRQSSAWNAVRLWKCLEHNVLWRSAFQAHCSYHAYPSTSCPVIVATLRSAFQALNT